MNLSGQNQLVFLKKENVIISYKEGDDFIYKRKTEDHYEKGYILSVRDFEVITNRDTVAYAAIERIRLPKGSKGNVQGLVGTALIVAGVGYLAVDLLNAYVFNVHSGVNENVVRVSIVLAATGGLLLFIPKQSIKLKSPYRLIKANPQSPYYR